RATSQLKVNSTATAGDVTIDATGKVTVEALSTSTATATVKQLAGAVVAGGLARPLAKIEGSATATVAGGADIDANSLGINASHTSKAASTGEALGAGVVAGTAADVDASVNVATSATLGDATVDTVGVTSVTATGTATATAKSGQLAVGAGTRGGSLADAIV